MRNSILLKYSLTVFLLIAFIDQAASQNENFELTKADSLAYNDSTSAVDFETYLANLKFEVFFANAITVLSILIVD